MKKRIWTLCLCCFTVILAQSIFFGAVGDPGSESDPVITESYFNNAVSGINASVSQLNTAINGIDTRVDTLESKTSTLENKASSSESKVTSLETRIATLESKSGTTVSSADLRVVAAFTKLNLSKKYAATNAKVELKSQPSATSSTLATMPFYAGVNIIDAQSGWVKVKYYSYTGWVLYDKLTPKMIY